MSDSPHSTDPSPRPDAAQDNRREHDAERDPADARSKHPADGDVAQWARLLPAALPQVFEARRDARPRPEAAKATTGTAGLDELCAEIERHVEQVDEVHGADFTIELPRGGRIDGHVRVDGARALVSLRARRPDTRELLAAHRRHLERKATAGTGVDVCVEVQEGRDEP
jgi:hypothetical protein